MPKSLFLQFLKILPKWLFMNGLGNTEYVITPNYSNFS